MTSEKTCARRARTTEEDSNKGESKCQPKAEPEQGDSKIQYAQAGEETANVVEVFT
jgi:hypothetical protein